MNLNDLFETTTSGSIASVAAPLGGTQKRAKKKEGSLFKGKKTSKPFFETQHPGYRPPPPELRATLANLKRDAKPGTPGSAIPGTTVGDVVKSTVPHGSNHGHYMHSKNCKTKSKECGRHDLGFGGVCYNCGWDPSKLGGFEPKKEVDETKRVSAQTKLSRAFDKYRAKTDANKAAAKRAHDEFERDWAKKKEKDSPPQTEGKKSPGSGPAQTEKYKDIFGQESYVRPRQYRVVVLHKEKMIVMGVINMKLSSSALDRAVENLPFESFQARWPDYKIYVTQTGYGPNHITSKKGLRPINIRKLYALTEELDKRSEEALKLRMKAKQIGPGPEADRMNKMAAQYEYYVANSKKTLGTTQSGTNEEKGDVQDRVETAYADQVEKNNAIPIDEAKLSEEEIAENDVVLAPGKGSKFRSDIISKKKTGPLSKFSPPYKATGLWISDRRGNRVSECESAEIAAEIVKLMNTPIDEATPGAKKPTPYRIWTEPKLATDKQNQKLNPEAWKKAYGEGESNEYYKPRYDFTGSQKDVPPSLGAHVQKRTIAVDGVSYGFVKKDDRYWIYQSHELIGPVTPGPNKKVTSEYLRYLIKELIRTNPYIKESKWYDNPLAVVKYHNIMREGAKVDRMVKHIATSEKDSGKSTKDAESIAWATANKRGFLDNKNKKKT